MEAQPLQLQDLAPAEPHLLAPDLPPWLWFVIAAGALALGALAVLFFMLRTDKPGPDLRRLELEKAYRDALAALDPVPGLPAQEAAVQASLALRRYLVLACRDPSLFETHEEFLARHQALENYPEDLRERVSTLLCRLASLKYDRHRNHDPAALASQSRELLENLHQHRPAA